MQIRTILIALTMTLALSGCSLVYRIDIPQGNYIDAKQVQKLRIGMNKEQVRFVMGTSMTEGTFNPDRWDYVYSFKHSSGETDLKRLSMFFNKQGLLEKVSGDYPVSPEFNQRQ